MRIQVVQGDITQQRVDAIVNSANKSLFKGGGVEVRFIVQPDLSLSGRRVIGTVVAR